jgi:hypothetical protein
VLRLKSYTELSTAFVKDWMNEQINQSKPDKAVERFVNEERWKAKHTVLVHNFLNLPTKHCTTSVQLFTNIHAAFVRTMPDGQKELLELPLQYNSFAPIGGPVSRVCTFPYNRVLAN